MNTLFFALASLFRPACICNDQGYEYRGVPVEYALCPAHDWRSTYHPARTRQYPILRILLLMIAFASVSVQVSAQDPDPGLRTAAAVFSTGAAMDWISTYRFLSAGTMHEINPVLRPFHNRPVPTVLAGATIDLAGTWIWYRAVGRKHPRLARIGFYSAAAFRIGLAINNTRKQSNAERNQRRYPN